MINKLRRKFVLVNMIIVTVMLTVIFGLVIFFTRESLEQESTQMLRSASMLPVQPGRPDNMPEKAAPFVFTITQTNGGYTVSGSEVIDFSDYELLAELYEAAMKSGSQTGTMRKHSLRYFVRNAPMGNSVIFADISSESAILMQLVKSCALIAVLSFGLFFVISVILARWTVKPAEAAWNEQKQFVADASHELKTPLTVIMTNAELLLDGQYPEEKRRQFSESILVMSKQMRGLTESLLELARSDNHTSPTVFEKINFSRLAEDSMLPFEPLYYEKNLTLTGCLEENIFITGDSIQLCRLMDILLDNALKYSLPQTEVVVKLKLQGSSCVFSVSGCGKEISKADQSNIFKRFYRIDKARSMNHSYGLGLAIAKSIVSGYGGRIWAESSKGINTFSVRLPVK